MADPRRPPSRRGYITGALVMFGLVAGLIAIAQVDGARRAEQGLPDPTAHSSAGVRTPQP